MKLLEKNMLLPSLLIGLLAIVVLTLSLYYMQPNPTIADTIGYMQASRQLAAGEGLDYFDSHNRIGRSFYTLYAFKVVQPNSPSLYFSYPPGTAILAAALGKLIDNSSAVHIFSALAAALAIVAISMLGTWLDNIWSGFWAALICFSLPIFLTFSTDVWTEVPSAAFLLLGLALYIKSSHRPRDDMAAIFLSILSAILIGTTFFFRFANITVIPALFFLIWCITGWKGFLQKRALGWFALLGMSVIAIFIYNTQIYGGPFITGYSPIHGWYDEPAFSIAYAFGNSFIDGKSVPIIMQRLLTDFRWLLIFLPITFLIQFSKSLFVLLVVACFLLAPYTVYAFAATGINARFVIPAWSTICVLIGIGIVRISSLLPTTTIRWLLGVSLAATMIYRLPATLTQLNERNLHAQAIITQAVQIANQTETNAIILSYGYNDLLAVYGNRSGMTYRHLISYDRLTGIYQYADFEELLIAEVTHLLRKNIPVYYLLDSQPPLLDSYSILERHFVIRPIGDTSPALFQLQLKPL